MKFKVNEDGQEYLNWAELSDPVRSGVFFDWRCSYCHQEKEAYKTCDHCGAPSRFYRAKWEKDERCI